MSNIIEVIFGKLTADVENVGIRWLPVSEAITQEMYLVGHEDYRGWFAVADLNALHEWTVCFGQDKLKYEPTHFAVLTPINQAPASPAHASSKTGDNTETQRLEPFGKLFLQSKPKPRP